MLTLPTGLYIPHGVTIPKKSWSTMVIDTMVNVHTMRYTMVNPTIVHHLVVVHTTWCYHTQKIMVYHGNSYHGECPHHMVHHGKF